MKGERTKSTVTCRVTAEGTDPLLSQGGDTEMDEAEGDTANGDVDLLQAAASEVSGQVVSR